MLSKYIDLTGRRYGRLVAIRKADERYDGRHAFWECQCDCGNKTIVRKDSLESGHAKSCGCYAKDRRTDFHLLSVGDKGTRLYKTWQGIKQRCLNPNANEYKNYGGRGITICDEWKDSYTEFKNWSIENGFNESLNGREQSIDRIDVNGNYEPNNCRWADSKTQNYNKRVTQRVNINGEEKTLIEISEEYDIPLSLIRSRYRRYKNGKCSLEELLSKDKITVSPKNSVYITVDGVTKNLTEWEKETGVSRKTISNRYKKGIRSKEELFKK